MPYQGSETFTTSFGGVISVFFKGFMLVFVLNQIKAMWTKSEWEVTAQTIAATKDSVQVQHNLKDEEYQNVSVAI